MELTILHLNVEKHKHVETVTALLKDEYPDIACFVEARQSDVEKMASALGYTFAFSPLFAVRETDGTTNEEGCAILSKFPIVSIQKQRYDDRESEQLPMLDQNEIISHDGVRPQDRFGYHYTLLSTSIEIGIGKTITVATTHFPVVDHTSLPLSDHTLASETTIVEIEHARNYLDTLMGLLKALPEPTIFTADLNNNRGDFVYDAIAEELNDIIPASVTSSIDPVLHRQRNLHLMVDAFMVSSDVTTKSIRAIEGVSDHKALLATVAFLQL